jgi:hypothetical protein
MFEMTNDVIGARLRLRLPDLIRRPLYSMFGRVNELSPAAVPSPPHDLYQRMYICIISLC